MKHSFIAALSAAILLSSCASQRAVEKVRYFQDLEDGASYATRVEQAITVKPEDKLTIVVNSKDPELAGMYNLPVISKYLAAEGSSFSQNQSVSSYTVDRKGNIDFPILGSIKVEGRTRGEIAEKIKSELVDRNLIRDPVVTVEFMNMYISVLGEVNKPGRYNFNQDRLTLIEALGLAGDLTIYAMFNAKKETVENGKAEDSKKQVAADKKDEAKAEKKDAAALSTTGDPIFVVTSAASLAGAVAAAVGMYMTKRREH